MCERNEREEKRGTNTASFNTLVSLIFGINNATSVSVYFVSSEIIFIVGFLCGLCFSRKVRGCVPSDKNHPLTNSPAPMYEAVVPTVNRQQEQDVELKENVAYM